MSASSSSREEEGFGLLVRQRFPRLPYAILFPVLWFLSLLYAFLIRCRNFFYDSSILKSHPVSVPVVSVGNITVGGTGKTPLVLKMAGEALRRGFRPAVVARGYRGRLEEGVILNDEGRMLESMMPGLHVIQDPDRVKAARTAVSGPGCDFIIMDDGFQHRRLHRGLDIVVIDATRPFGYSRVLPAGLLREPLTGLERAQAIVLSRCDQLEPASLEAVEARLKGISPDAPVFRTVHAPVRLRDIGRTRECEPSALAGSNVFAVSGIAHPSAFEKTLAALGARIAGRAVFPDHHWYSREDLVRVQTLAGKCGAEHLVTTAKDAVRFEGLEGHEAIKVLDVEIRFLGGEQAFWDLVFGRLCE